MGEWFRHVFEAPVYSSDLHDATALGAAILAAAALGLGDQADVAATARRMSRGWHKVAKAPETREHYRRSARAYRLLYPALAEVFETIED